MDPIYKVLIPATIIGAYTIGVVMADSREEIRNQKNKIERVDKEIRTTDMTKDYTELVTFAIEDSSKIIKYNKAIQQLDEVIDSLRTIKNREQHTFSSMKIESYKSWYKVFE